MCVTVLFEANRDIAACFCQRTSPRSIVDVPITDMAIAEERKAVTFISLDQYVRFPIERFAETNPSDGGILLGFTATFVANFRLRVLRGCSHSLALMTDLYHRRARRKTPRRNRRMTLVEEACRSSHYRCQPVQLTSLHACSSGGRCQPSYAHCCTRVCPGGRLAANSRTLHV